MTGSLGMAEWERQESGWWTKRGVGGITLERDRKWWFWPLHGEKVGPFETLREAMDEAVFRA